MKESKILINLRILDHEFRVHEDGYRVDGVAVTHECYMTILETVKVFSSVWKSAYVDR